MTDNSMMNRLKTAAGFQRQAIRALLPDGMEGHIDAIEKEIKEMITEIMSGVVTECMTTAGKSGKAEGDLGSSVRKVTID